MLRCSKEAFARCPTNHLCGRRDEATFTEGSDCDRFNQQVAEENGVAVRRETMKIMLDNGAIMPTRAHPWDAGLDLYAMEDAKVVGSKVFDTGVHISVPEGCVGLLKSKSGLNVRHNLVGEGVIDAHYTGSIKVKLYNHSKIPYSVRRGDKISQLVIVPCLLPELELVEALDDTDRGDGGFGSTGR